MTTCASEPRAPQRFAPLAVDAKTLAVMLDVSVRKIRQLGASGKLPRPVTIGARSIRWTVDELRARLAAEAPDRVTWKSLQQAPASLNTALRGMENECLA